MQDACKLQAKNSLKVTSSRLPTPLSPLLGGGDNCAILDFSQRHLTGHSWTYLRDFQKRRIFFLKNYPPALQKPFLKIQRGDPLDVEKKISSNQVFIKAMLWHSVSRFQNGITLRYWKYFLKIFFQKIGKNIFDTKYLQKIFAIPKCYTILESWEQMP